MLWPPERCPHGHRLVELKPWVYACLDPATARVIDVWHGSTYLASPAPPSVIRQLAQLLVDERARAGA